MFVECGSFSDPVKCRALSEFLRSASMQVRCLWRVCQENFDVVARFRVKWKCMCSYSNRVWGTFG